jgi:hypothetical protein
LLLIAAASVQPARAADAAPGYDSRALSAIAMHWMSEWDAQNWASCWQEFCPLVQANERDFKWSLREFYHQEFLGKPLSRKFVNLERTMIRGEIVIVEFETTFEHKGLRSEGVYLEKESNGAWTIYAHWTKALTEEWPGLYR